MASHRANKAQHSSSSRQLVSLRYNAPQAPMSHHSRRNEDTSNQRSSSKKSRQPSHNKDLQPVKQKTPATSRRDKSPIKPSVGGRIESFRGDHHPSASGRYQAPTISSENSKKQSKRYEGQKHKSKHSSDNKHPSHRNATTIDSELKSSETAAFGY